MPATSRSARSGSLRSASGRSGSPSKSSSTQPRSGDVQHLAQVVVAVDALQEQGSAAARRPRRRPRARPRRRRPGQAPAVGPGAARPAAGQRARPRSPSVASDRWAASRPGWRAPRPWRRPSARAAIAEVLAAGQRLARPRARRRARRAGTPARRRGARWRGRRGAARPATARTPCPTGAAPACDPAVGQCRLDDHVGVLAGVQHPEDLEQINGCARAVTARGVCR